MKRSVILAAAVAVALVAAARLTAQPPAGDGPPPAPVELVPYPGTAPPGVAVVKPPPGVIGCAPCDGPPCTHKVCVPEVKEQKKTVYCSRTKEFCLKRCHCLAGLLGHDHDHDCCVMRTGRVLVKKSVPDCPKVECVIKEVPSGAGCAPCAPCLPVMPAAPK